MRPGPKTGGAAITQAIHDWIRRATPTQRAEYVRSGSRGPGMPIDLAPPGIRARDVATHSGTPRARRAQP